MLILKYVIFIAGLADIDQVIGDLFSIHVVIGQILTRPDIHRTIDLPGISADDLRIQLGGESGGEGRLSGSRRPRIVISSYDFMIQTYEKKGHPQRG